ncbi:MAG: caspase family protein [Desulfobacteraceae bacterium]|nr:caspase family protein [Desulfobacteraceae bacterium]MBC2754347.1 caspase family protein [Desulfobacteraceae bacterium]
MKPSARTQAKFIAAAILVMFFVMAGITGCSSTKKATGNQPPSFSLPNNAITNNVDQANPEKAFSNPKSDISTADPYVASVTEFKDLTGNHEIRWEWFDPEGNLYYNTGNHPVSSSGRKMAATGIAWHKISVKGDRAESLQGKWHVDVYMDDLLYKSNSFYISKKIETMFVDVDVNVPRTAMKNPDAVAVVIGNKNYWHKDVPEVKYAIRDADAISEYLVKTLGYREKNIMTLYDVPVSIFNELFGTSNSYKGKLYNFIKPGKSDVFIYYSGHGAPDLTSSSTEKKAYIVPVDCDPASVTLNGYSLDLLYSNLAKLPARHVTIVMDTCFSGVSGAGETFIKSYSPFTIPVKATSVKTANTISITSAQGNQVSSWYDEKQHSLFTYFFLKAVQGEADANKNGKLTYQEIYDYVSDTQDGVPYYARRLFNGREQTPTIDGTGTDKVLIRY